MGHYRSNLRDLEFNLFEVLRVQDQLGRAPYEGIDEAAARAALGEVHRLATGPAAEPYADADRNPPAYHPDSRTVTLPASFKRAYDALRASDWWLLELPERLGGLNAPPTLRWAVNEMLLGANPAAFMYMSGPGFAAILDRIGTPEQQRIAQLIIERGWGATMALTEPDAGSDVGAGRAKATDNGDGTWRVEGIKRFITSGEHDLAENIIHFVLARPDGAGPGTKGLSLFLVPKVMFDPQTGELASRNGVYATNLERKMGLKASATCELAFGQDEPAIGWLVGNVHDGIAQMFQIIEYARMLVGTKAIAALSSGYLNALDYAKTRVQGPDMTRMADKAAPRVTITHHPDVRRSLMTQKAYAEGMRALVLYAASWQDRVHAAEAGTPGIDVDQARRVNDFLLPIVKGVGSERSYELLGASLQVLGGSGYLQDYPIEQYLRDSKIDSLYEGVTYVQGADLLFRKILRDQFAAIAHLASLIAATAQQREDDPLAVERELLTVALADVQAMVGVTAGWVAGSRENPEELYKAGLNAVRLLMSCGDLIIGWLLIEHADVALAALARIDTQHRDYAFYQGKAEAARWFASQRLPLLTAERGLLERTTLDVMAVPELAF